MYKLKILTVLMAASLLLASAAALRAQDVDGPAPHFALKDLNGRSLILADYKGKVLFLNFWATWCPPCRAEIPDFIDAYATYKDKGLEILGISVDLLTPDQLQTFVDKARINYPIALGDESLVEAYKPGPYIPTTIIIDKKGIVRHRHVGQMDKETLLKLFKEYGDAL